MEKFILTGVFLFLLILIFRSPIPPEELEHKELPYKTIEVQSQTDIALEIISKTKEF